MTPVIPGEPGDASDTAVLETHRLSLREMTDADLPALRAILHDPEVMVAYEGAFSDDESLAWLRRMQDSYRRDGFGMWAVVLRSSGQMIGQCGITRQRIDDDEAIEVGYLFRRDHWGNGYAVEAAAASRDWAFRTLGTDEVYAKVRSTNVASMNVAIRLGMTVRRTFVTHYRGVDMPHLAFAISRTAWQSKSGHAGGGCRGDDAFRGGNVG
ncbi:GNAT family N-acetyltransferase [Microbacterium dextranolyticum]|uniref:Acetyltransferase n=1 Tax=Microbacterium dextranolyticum TaxID=36806 RepID=A0A9W6HMP3_9MICO|nr:GNAT family N-acetyltransferase [Microbacterium dextranolyticum]MBM7462859.1 RimJ/RimL family protein N-acetyltransferase [Microbacterium dextranolyticum]GLJ96036.1 acetyltransferase [Microbacterium dextranolyticum]